MRNADDDILAALRDRWGSEWRIWLVRCHPGPDIWCAYRWGDEKNVINATSPRELERQLAAAS